jgi:hypothetical protein
MSKHFFMLCVAFVSVLVQAANFNPTTVAGLISDINTANGNAEADVIDLGGLNFSLNITNYANDLTDGRNGLPSILSDGGNSLTIQNGSIVRNSISDAEDFRLLHASIGANLFLDNVTLQDGLAAASDISVLGDAGGAIFLNQANLTVNQGVFVDNRAVTFGGAITGFAGATATISNSSFLGNEALNLGGAIHNDPSSTITSISGSTFAGNHAEGGGAISNFSATLGTIVNSTFSYNIAHTEGGAIRNSNGAIIDNIFNSTIASNIAGLTAGGIYNEVGSVITSIESTIVADNYAINDPDIFGDFINASYNLVGVDQGHNITNGVGNNHVGSLVSPLDPGLDSLANNGGPTATRALLFGVAIDGGSNPNAEANDQRGPGFARIVGSDPDIGAYEIQ